MSINITVGSGQGVTQAIKAHLEKQGVKLTNVKLSDWQNVMTLVNQNQQINKNAGKDSIFSGGNNVSRIGENNGNNNWKTDFQVQAGQVMQFDSGIFNKIVAVLTGKAQEAPAPQETPAPKPQTPPTLDTKPQGLSQDANIPDKIEVPADVQRQSTESMIDQLGGKIIQREVNGEMKDIAVVTVDGQKVRREINEDGTLGDTLAATKTFGKNEYITGDFPTGTKILEREVNGEKQQIAVYEDENGNKQRSLVVKDPETGASKLGDNLVTISTLGKNKYITQTEMDNQMRTALGLPQDAQLPEDIKGSYVNIGGEPTLIFKKDGKTLDQTGLREYVQNLKQGSEAQQVQEQDTVTPSDQQTETVNTDSSSTPELHTPQMDTQVFDQPPVYRGLETPELHTPQIDTQVFDQPPVYRGFETPEQQANLNHVLQDGYQVVQQDGGMILSKDGKNYQINPNGTLGAEIKADAPAPAPETKEAPQTEDKPKQNIPAESDKPHKLTKEEINENINNLKPGESYSYSLTTSNPMGSTKAPVTWTRNDDGTLTRTRKEANFSNKSFDTLKTVYSEDRSRVISQDTQELMFGAQVVVSNQYDESGNVTSKSIDMQDLMNSQRGRMMLTSDLTNPITKKADKYAEQTFKNTDGEVLVTYKDGQWFNDEGKEISDSKAYKIMDKARKEQTIGELVQIPIEG